MQPDMENLKKRVQENRDLVDRIFTKVPGYRGYVEKAENYNADRIIRGFIADKIHDIKGELDSISSDLFKEGKSDLLPEVESQSNNLERLFKKVKYADYAGSASFSDVKITDEDQNRLLEYDWRLISEVDGWEALLRDMTGDNAAALKNLKAAIKEFDRAFDDRKNVLLEVL